MRRNYVCLTCLYGCTIWVLYHLGVEVVVYPCISSCLGLIDTVPGNGRYSSFPAAAASELRLAQIMLRFQSQEEEEAIRPYVPIIAWSIIHHLSKTRPRGCEWQKSIRPTIRKDSIQVPGALKASGGDQSILLPAPTELNSYILRRSEHTGHHGA